MFTNLFILFTDQSRVLFSNGKGLVYLSILDEFYKNKYHSCRFTNDLKEILDSHWRFADATDLRPSQQVRGGTPLKNLSTIQDEIFAKKLGFTVIFFSS